MHLNHFQVAYHDLFPYFLLSEASVEDLNSRLEKPVSADNFRPNILVTGCDAYSEVILSQSYYSSIIPFV
jgi:uncharacterized protein YcbX